MDSYLVIRWFWRGVKLLWTRVNLALPVACMSDSRATSHAKKNKKWKKNGKQKSKKIHRTPQWDISNRMVRHNIFNAFLQWRGDKWNKKAYSRRISKHQRINLYSLYFLNGTARLLKLLSIFSWGAGTERVPPFYTLCRALNILSTKNHTGLCSLVCYLCHISNWLPGWLCEYGMSACVILYVAAKTALFSLYNTPSWSPLSNQCVCVCRSLSLSLSRSLCVCTCDLRVSFCRPPSDPFSCLRPFQPSSSLHPQRLKQEKESKTTHSQKQKKNRYTFLLHRASLTQGMVRVFPKWLFKKVLPLYIGSRVFLFFLFALLCRIFRTQINQHAKKTQRAILRHFLFYASFFSVELLPILLTVMLSQDACLRCVTSVYRQEMKNAFPLFFFFFFFS